MKNREIKGIETEKEKETTVSISEHGIESRLEALASRVGGKRALAQMAGISESQLYRILAGESMPKMDSVIRICEATGVSVDWLATGRGPGPGDEHQVRDGSSSYVGLRAEMADTEEPETVAGRGHLDRDALQMALETINAAAQRSGHQERPPEQTTQVFDLLASFYELLEAEPDSSRRSAMRKKLENIATAALSRDQDKR